MCNACRGRGTISQKGEAMSYSKPCSLGNSSEQREVQTARGGTIWQQCRWGCSIQHRPSLRGVLAPPPSTAPENQVGAVPTPIKSDTKFILSLEPREPPQATPPAYHQAPPSPEGEVAGECRVATREVWSIGPSSAYHEVVELAYYLISFNEIPPDLTQDDLPQRARSWGRRRFIAREGRPLHWRCMRC